MVKIFRTANGLTKRENGKTAAPGTLSLERRNLIDWTNESRGLVRPLVFTNCSKNN